MSITKEEIGSALQSFLSRCSVTYREVPMDLSFLKLCYTEARKREYMVEGSEEMKPFIPTGVAIAITTYAHLENISIRVWMALITAAATYCDDKFLKDTKSLDMFYSRILRGQPQEDRVLDAFVDLLEETYRYYPPATAGIMVSSMINLVNAVLLDYQTAGMKVSAAANNYPMFTRRLSGVGELYGIAAFPPEVRVEAFIQAVPDLSTLVINGNDILSFYKEEMVGESGNYISLLAKSRGCQKQDVFHDLIQEVVEAHKRILRILDSDKAALDAYSKFVPGYMEFHFAEERRYHLGQLMSSRLASVDDALDA
ncbi:hypothetical protein GYMLUDRAFT_1012408 [Collybiopsis luxurians FD-317 M1]|uniref:Terpene synthase n=1 Tax=Collybiopsis luxurians FD-317 M1 TaxID=944289 RepID=A0A0D0CFR0_9AGAR|nr:hypothetical protein GYMLUDRAFT_1012408 [Collybiopsis luxurians FD-317 M1]